MLAIIFEDYEKYGCPNCGCDTARSGMFSGGGTTSGTCRHCGLKFELRYNRDTVPFCSYGAYPEDPSDPKSEYVMEKAIFIEHPRKGMPKWKWEPADERPEEGEYWKSRGIGYDLSGFVKTRRAGLRLDGMVSRVLGRGKHKSWLDYREYEPEWIQYKFDGDEFDLKYIDENTRDGIITEDILKAAKL